MPRAGKTGMLLQLHQLPLQAQCLPTVGTERTWALGLPLQAQCLPTVGTERTWALGPLALQRRPQLPEAAAMQSPEAGHQVWKQVWMWGL